MPKQHSALVGNDLHQPKGIGVETTAEFLIISQSLNIISGSSTSTGSFGRVEATTLGGTLTTAAQTNITSVGTIGTGTWQGTAIASAYLDSDTAHLSGTQTFSGAKTFKSGNKTIAIPSKEKVRSHPFKECNFIICLIIN